MAQTRLVLGTGAAVWRRELIDVPTRAGSMPALLLQPSEPAIGMVVYLHGGGWVIGAIADYEVLARQLSSRPAARFWCRIIGWPRNIRSSWVGGLRGALLWAARERGRLAGARGALVVAGDSAGAILRRFARPRWPAARLGRPGPDLSGDGH